MRYIQGLRRRTSGLGKETSSRIELWHTLEELDLCANWKGREEPVVCGQPSGHCSVPCDAEKQIPCFAQVGLYYCLVVFSLLLIVNRTKRPSSVIGSLLNAFATELLARPVHHTLMYMTYLIEAGSRGFGPFKSSSFLLALWSCVVINILNGRGWSGLCSS